MEENKAEIGKKGIERCHLESDSQENTNKNLNISVDS